MAVKIRVEPILPSGKFPSQQHDLFVKLATNYLRGDLKNRLTKALLETTRNWTHKPTFQSKVNTVNGLSLLVYPDARTKSSRIWIYVHEGTRPRTIRARLAPRLTVQSYNPHTKRGGRWGGPGNRHGEISYPKVVVNWPGIDKRDFSKEIASRQERQIRRDIQNIVRKAFR